MSWVAAAVGGASLISGLSGSRSAKKQQKQALALQEQQLAFDKKRYADVQNQYGGVIQQNIDTAKQGVKADLQGVSDRTAADIALQYRGANEGMLRNQQRMGINPNSGRADSMARQSALSLALASAGGITANRENERRTAEQQTWDRRASISSQGINQINGSISDMRNSTNNMANTYSNMASQQAQQAGQLLSGAGSMFGGAIASGGLKMPSFGDGAAGGGIRLGDLSMPTGMNNPAANGLVMPSIAPMQAKPLF